MDAPVLSVFLRSLYVVFPLSLDLCTLSLLLDRCFLSLFPVAVSCRYFLSLSPVAVAVAVSLLSVSHVYLDSSFDSCSRSNRDRTVVAKCGRNELGGVRGPLLLGVQENKQTREEQNNRIRTIARLITVSLAPRA